MSSLFGSLSIALSSLLAQQAALETTSQNIANLNTPGYSRQRPVLREESAVLSGTTLIGGGVSLEKVESIRDQILELRLHQESQQQGQLEAFLGSTRQVEALFNETRGAGLQEVMSKFFDSLQALAVNPTSLPLRQAVLTAGQNLAETFRRTAGQLGQLQHSLDQSVTQSVAEINTLAANIADLNREVAAMQNAGQAAGELEDQRTEAIRKLAGLVDLSVIQADRSLTLTTAKGTALVVGAQSFALETRTDLGTGFQHIFAQGTDITSTLTAGQVGGSLQVRDQTIPSYLADLDNLAAQLRNSVNAVHRAGFDLAGAPGGDFFRPFVAPLGPNAGAANSFAVTLSDPAKLAASLDGTPGNNGNLAALADIRNQTIVNGQRPLDFYANFVFRIGNDVSDASAQLEAGDLVLQQLQNQRGAISGVSLDEEAANLIRYQRAFEAAARVVATVNDLLDTAVNLGRN